MVTLEQPSMAVNDPRLDAVVQMSINKTVGLEDSASQVLGYVVNAINALPGKKLKNLILNCHGDPGQLYMGIGITRDLADRFSVLAPNGKPLVERIYLRACKVARIDGPGSPTDGNLFCSDIAKFAKCVVVASTATQTTGHVNSMYGAMPANTLDIFEGTTLTYGPKGNVLSAATNPMWSKWDRVE